MSLDLRRLHAPAISVRARLSLIQLVLGIAAIAIGAATWHTISSEYRAAEQLSLLGRASALHADTSMTVHALRADVNAALMVQHAGAATLNEVQASTAENARRLRAAQAALHALPLSADLIDRLTLTGPLAESYAAQALSIVALAAQDRDGAAALEPAFRIEFLELIGLHAQAAEFLSRRVDTERRTASSAFAARRWIAGSILIVAAVTLVLVGVLKVSIQRTLGSIRDTASALAGGNLTVRSFIASGDEVGELAAALNKMADDLQDMIARLQADAERDAFGAQLVEALEMADAESEVHQVVARVMERVAPELPMELLLSDSSRAHLERAAVHPTAGAPGCRVESPFNCVAVRRGNPVVFEDSQALNACPHLRDRPCGPAAAVCVPVSFMGRSLGVLHAAGPVQQLPGPVQLAQLRALSMQSGARIGTVRVFERTQLQARTDSLTGLSNRRSIERFVHDLQVQQIPFAFALADLDRFKHLNDTSGHAAGDQALRLFAEVLRSMVRTGDQVARWGGEEFALVLPKAGAADALDIVERCRAELERALTASANPRFTASYGIADSTMAGGIEEIARIADQALYRSKDAGRDRATVGSPGRADPMAARHEIEHDATINLRILTADNEEGSAACKRFSPELRPNEA